MTFFSAATPVIVQALLALPPLDNVKQLHKALEFEKCIEAAQLARQGKTPLAANELRDVEVFAGLCHFGLGKVGDAKQAFRAALKADPAAELPPYSSPKVVELFSEVKKANPPPAPPTPFQETDFPEDAVPTSPPSRDKPADVPLKPEPKPPPPEPNLDSSASAVSLSQQLESNDSFFQKHPVTAPTIVLGVATVVTAAIAVVLGVTAANGRISANNSVFESDFLARKETANTFATGANVLYVVSGSCALATIISWWAQPPAAKEQ
jgi:hypothetical protein